MKKKVWKVSVGEKSYTISINRKCFVIDGVEYPKKECLVFSKYYAFHEYKLPIEGAEVLLVTGMLGMELIVDGINQSNGKPYHRMENLPWWAWLFVAANLTGLSGGAIGGAFGAMGAFVTIAICASPDNSNQRKIVSSVLVLFGSWALILIVGGLLNVMFSAFR